MQTDSWYTTGHPSSTWLERGLETENIADNEELQLIIDRGLQISQVEKQLGT